MALIITNNIDPSFPTNSLTFCAYFFDRRFNFHPVRSRSRFAICP